MACTQTDIPGEIFAYQAMFPEHKHDHIDPFLAYKAVSDPDTLHYHQAMREPDRNKFESGMEKEIKDQFENGNFTVIRKSEVPEGQIILPAVWQMRRKRDARTGRIKKYKARLNIDGSRTRRGLHFNETYSPVASWNSVRMLLKNDCCSRMAHEANRLCSGICTSTSGENPLYEGPRGSQN